MMICRYMAICYEYDDNQDNNGQWATFYITSMPPLPPIGPFPPPPPPWSLYNKLHRKALRRTAAWHGVV